MPLTHSLPVPPQNWAQFSLFVYEGRDAVWDASPPRENQFANPILAGFYPDPSICRAGDHFYLVNSSFSFFPGIPIFKSKDLVDWTQIGHVLDRPSQLNLDGLPVSSGIFAPDISFQNGTFYLITTNVRGIGNFLVTATDPAGPWSEPVLLPEINGIDPSLFFDEDGRAYIVHNGEPPNNTPLYEGHRAVWMWEYDLATQKIVGQGRILVNGGTDISQKPVWIEGPHLFKRGGYYYLCAAEGGTGAWHSQVIFRAKTVWGPYEPFEANPILTQRDLDPTRPHPITSAGHADLVETANGEWWAVFLAIRPYEGDFCNIGRETFLLPVTWEGDWPRILERGVPIPSVAQRPALPTSPIPQTPTNGSFVRYNDFERDELGLEWTFLRTPREKWWALMDGSLRIEPRAIALHSLGRKSENNGNPSFIARRQHHTYFSAATMLVLGYSSCEAGLAALQNEANYFFLGVKTSPNIPGEIFLETCSRQPNNALEGPRILARAPLPENMAHIELKITGQGGNYGFFFRTEEGDWTPLLENADGRILSSQAAGGFVGTVIGLFARPV